jgi:NitT/TauT family transport system substrate-binding protein
MDRKLRIGHLSTFYHTAMVLMARGEIGGRLGREVEWRLFGTGPAIVDAFKQGDLDIAYIGLPPAIIGIERGAGIVCVAGGHVEGTVMAARDKYQGGSGSGGLGRVLRQFAGRRIGVPGTGSIHDVILKASLSRFGLGRDIAVVNFAWADRLLEAVVKDEVAAAVGTPALAVAVIRYAGGKILFPPSQLWPYNPSYGILASKSFLVREREIVEEFLLLHEEATSLLREHPAEAAGLISRYVGFVDEAFVFDTLKVSPRYCAQITKEFISSTMEFVSAMKRLGYISREPVEEEIFDLSLIKKVHPEKDHYGVGLSSA